MKETEIKITCNAKDEFKNNYDPKDLEKKYVVTDEKQQKAKYQVTEARHKGNNILTLVRVWSIMTIAQFPQHK